MGRLLIAGAVLALGQAAPAFAGDGFCRNGIFTEQNPAFGLARISGQGKARFYDDMNGCPSVGPSCQQKTYVVPGDRVVTGRSLGQFVCVYFPNGVGGTAGWMPRSRLTALPVNPRPPLTAWLGRWADNDNWVRFSRAGSGLKAEGMAYWPGANPSPEDRPGGPNTGEIAGLLRLSGNRAVEPECQVTFHLLNDILIAVDPVRRCDGMNVTFSGVYQRVKR
ncbi:MAG TPA: hypothetical protein VFV30_02330 [Novosphingobium sp.]|nr:hypothetical protein [Novosphingobium sp.]